MRQLGLALLAGIIVSSSLMGDPIFIAQISITPNDFCTASPSISGPLQPAIAGGQCSFFTLTDGIASPDGNSRASAAAWDGHVGVTAEDIALNPGGRSGTSAFASETGTVTFTGPAGQIGDTLVDFNINFGGVVNAAFNGQSGAQVTFDAALNNQPYGLDFYSFDGAANVTCIPLGTFQCDAVGLSGSYLTDPVLVPLNTPVPFALTISANAIPGGFPPGDSARADFSNSLDLPIGSDIFNLPDGFTANSTDFDIVDNRLAGADTGTPEPSTFYLGCLSILAFATVGLIRHLYPAARGHREVAGEVGGIPRRAPG